MLKRRVFMALAAASLVAACSDITDINRAKSDTGPLKLNKVRVDTSNLKLTSEGRDVKKSRAELAADLTAALGKELGPVSDPNGLPADVNVTVDKVYLARIVDRALVGTSYVDSTISVTDAATGEVIVAPQKVRGDSDQFRGPLALGVITTQSVEKDYQSALEGYAKALTDSLVASK